MLLVLCGASCTGKTTIRDLLVKHYNFKSIVTYTDRPKREGEEEGVDYHFCTPEHFDALIESNFFCEFTQYQIASDTPDSVWRYGTSKESIESFDNDAVLISNPDGLQEIIRQYGKSNICVCRIVADDYTVRNRLKERGDNEEEAERRMAADVRDFRAIDGLEDMLIPNNYTDDIYTIVKGVNDFYKIYRAGKDDDE